MPDDRKGFSKREKRLLFFLAIFAFTAIMVVFAILPFNNRLHDERQNLASIEMEQTRIQNLLASEPSIIENHENAIMAHEELLERFLPEMHISDVGRLLTRICEEHDLEPIDQRLANPSAFGGNDDSAILTMNATMTVRGTYNNLKSLIDTIEQTEYMRISDVAFVVAESTRVGVVVIGDDYSEGYIVPVAASDVDFEIDRILLSFEVIMMREFEEEEETEEYEG